MGERSQIVANLTRIATLMERMLALLFGTVGNACNRVKKIAIIKMMKRMLALPGTFANICKCMMIAGIKSDKAHASIVIRSVRKCMQMMKICCIRLVALSEFFCYL